MRADSRVVSISLSDVPAVTLYEREPGHNVVVLYVLVRSDYNESDEDAVKRANRIAKKLTSALADKKSSPVSK